MAGRCSTPPMTAPPGAAPSSPARSPPAASTWCKASLGEAGAGAAHPRCRRHSLPRQLAAAASPSSPRRHRSPVGLIPRCATAPDVIDFVGYGPGAVSFEGSAPARSPGVERRACCGPRRAAATATTTPPISWCACPPRGTAPPLEPVPVRDPGRPDAVGATPAAGWCASTTSRGGVTAHRCWGRHRGQVPGVVTAIAGNLFWMQDPAARCRRSHLGGHPRLPRCPAPECTRGCACWSVAGRGVPTGE